MLLELWFELRKYIHCKSVRKWISCFYFWQHWECIKQLWHLLVIQAALVIKMTYHSICFACKYFLPYILDWIIRKHHQVCNKILIYKTPCSSDSDYCHSEKFQYWPWAQKNQNKAVTIRPSYCCVVGQFKTLGFYFWQISMELTVVKFMNTNDIH